MLILHATWLSVDFLKAFVRMGNTILKDCIPMFSLACEKLLELFPARPYVKF